MCQFITRLEGDKEAKIMLLCENPVGCPRYTNTNGVIVVTYEQWIALSGELEKDTCSKEEPEPRKRGTLREKLRGLRGPRGSKLLSLSKKRGGFT